MKNLELTSLSPQELQGISGGDLFSGLLGGLLDTSGGTGGSTADYTAYMAGMSAAYTAMGAGHAAHMAQSGAGMAMFLTLLRFPVQ